MEKERVKRELIRLIIRFLSSVAARVTQLLLFGSETRKARALLGELFSVMRWGDRENKMGGFCRKYDIHASVVIGLDTLLSGDGRITIGENTYLGRDCQVVSDPSGAKITIGKDCAISHNVNIRTQRHPLEVHSRDREDTSSLAADIVIGEGVLIGANVFIRGGVSIGDHSVVGANSVVTRNVPPQCVFGGVPARQINSKGK